MEEFAKGDRVQVKIPGFKSYQSAKVTGTEDGYYTVRMSDGYDERVASKNIRLSSKSQSFRKSPARKEKSPSRRSPSRNVTASPQRTKSPSRKSPSRTRKGSTEREVKNSPGRPRKTVQEREETKTKAPVAAAMTAAQKKSKKNETLISSITDSVQEVFSEKPKASVRGRTRKITPEIIDDDTDDNMDVDYKSSVTVTRRSARISNNRETERVLHLKPNYESAVRKLTEFSDEDELIKTLPKKSMTTHVVVDKSVAKEFGGTLGVSGMLIFVVLFPLYLHVFCNEKSCSFTKLPTDVQKYKLIQTYINAPAAVSFFSFTALIAAFGCLPFGKKITGPPNKNGRLEYRINGLLTFVVLLTIVATLEIYKIPVMNTTIANYFQHLAISIVVASVLAVCFYVKSYFAPIVALSPHGVSTSRLYNFCVGRETHPRIGRFFDLKMFLFRMTIFKCLLINAAFVYKSVSFTPATVQNNTEIYNWRSINVQPTLLTVAGLQFVYLLDGIVCEAQWPQSFEMQQEAAGALYVLGYFVYPTLITAITKYVYDHKVQLPQWELALVALAFTIGFIIYRWSNSQKNAYRKNPYNPALAHLETIPTAQGKNLLVSGWWGIVRHPNYLGDLILTLSWLPLCYNVPSALHIAMTVFLLLHRVQRDGRRCKKRYGAAWERYCQRVRYAIIPKVY